MDHRAIITGVMLVIAPRSPRRRPPEGPRRGKKPGGPQNSDLKQRGRLCRFGNHARPRTPVTAISN